MYGFLVTDGLYPVSREDNKSIIYGKYTFIFDPLNKFYNDILFYEDDTKIVLLDGVVFNIDELKKEYDKNEWRDVFDTIIQNDEKRFMDKLRGSFAGVVLFKRDNSINAFTCHMGEHPIYYYKNDSRIIIASHVEFIARLVRAEGHYLGPNLGACYEMLMTGSCLNTNTIYSNVRRVPAGRYLYLSGITEEIVFYHKFENIPEHEYTLDECIERGDKLFRQAVDRIFRKSKEYGYQPECDLSGGLDSRMATWVAHDLGYKNVLNICYCVKNHLDNTISEKISNDLGNKYFFLPMDSFILGDVDKKVGYFGGQVDYTLCTGAVKALESIDDNVGICCTGLLGEIQNAYWVEGEQHSDPDYWLEALRSKMFAIHIPEVYKLEYSNYEQMNLYELSGNFYMSSAIARQQMVEVSSPFIDVDYLDFVYKIPLKYRRHYKYVMAWMDKKYPEAARYTWTSTGKPVSESHDADYNYCGSFNPNKNYIRRAINKAARILHLKYQMDTKYDMNPIDKWFREDTKIQEIFKKMYNERIELIADETLKRDVIKMYNSEKSMDKIMAINLLSAVCQFMGKNKA